MRKASLASAAVALLVLFAIAPRANPFTSRSHGHIATNAFDALPDFYEENLDNSMLYTASLAPDDWRQADFEVHLGKDYYAWPGTYPGLSPTYAFDDDYNTQWQADTPGAGTWVAVDLVGTYRVEKIVFTYAALGSDVRLQYSSDNVIWWNFDPVIDDVGLIETVENSCEGRYWRLYCYDIPSGEYHRVEDIKLYARADNAHMFSWIKPQAFDWLRRADNDYRDGRYDSCVYAMGIATHYISDAMCLVHQDNVWDNLTTPQASDGPGFDEEIGGWSLHKHFEEQCRYHEPATPSPNNYRRGIDNYIENYLGEYLDNFAARQENLWSYWLSTRDCRIGKEGADNAAQLVLDAWCSMLWGRTGVPP